MKGLPPVIQQGSGGGEDVNPGSPTPEPPTQPRKHPGGAEAAQASLCIHRSPGLLSKKSMF